MRYLPLSDADRSAMLKVIGAGSIDELFKDGGDTAGLVLLKVHADRLHYWDGYREGEIDLQSGTRSDRSVEEKTS